MRQLARGNLMYAAEYDETFPRKDDWFTAVAPYTARMRRIRCPIAAKNQGPETVGYGMNVALTGHKAPSREKVLVLIFESQDTKRGAFGGKHDIANPGRHGSGSRRGNNFSYTDGSAKFMADADNPGKWEP
jgi:hypothetical protein